MANTYGMLGGAGADSTYSGSYNITPTTSDITLATKNTGLEGDMTIQGDSDLVAGNINYGKSIFGVDGSYLALNMGQGEGTAYISGVVSEGDVIRSVSDKQDLVEIGEMPLVEKYTFKLTQSGEKVVSQHNDLYITYYQKTGTQGYNFRCYNSSGLVSDINMGTILNVTSGYIDEQFYFPDVNSGNLIIISNVYSEDGSFGSTYATSYNIQNGTYSIIRFPSAHKIYPSSVSISENYITLFSNKTSGNYGIFILNKDMSYSSFAGGLVEFNASLKITTASTNELDYCNYKTLYGEDGNLYLYNTRLQGSNISGSYDDFICINTSGIVWKKSVKQSDLDFNGKSKLTSGYYTSLLYSVSTAGLITLFYSNADWDSYTNDGANCVAIFQPQMASKTSDQVWIQRDMGAIEHAFLGSYYESSTNTILLWCDYGVYRIKDDGTIIYAYHYNSSSFTTGLSKTSVNMLDTKQVDYTHATVSGYNATAEDRSAIKTKTITTDTYTAELEEV